MSDYPVKPRSDEEVRKLAKKLREFFGVAADRRVDVIACAKSRSIWTVHGERELRLELRSDDEMGSDDGTTIYEDKLIIMAVKLAIVAANFYDELAKIRPELGHKDSADRRLIRERSLVDSAVMMHGYAAIMKDYNADLGKFGRSKASELWQNRLRRLSSTNSYTFQSWSGDFFAKQNPVWRETGIVKLRGASRRSNPEYQAFWIASLRSQ